MADIDFGLDTLKVIHDLHDRGVNKLSVIMRHSARNYDHDMTMEPFMWLTEEGRDLSRKLGEGLPENLSVRLFSSYIGRCIETAYLIDKGFSKKGGEAENNVVTRNLAPFYVLDFREIIDIIIEQNVFTFIRNWINEAIPGTVLMGAESSAKQMIQFMMKRLQETKNGSLDISITHDWNMYLLKEFGLGLPHEDYGKIEYLEGVVLFEKDGAFYLTNHQVDPVALKF